MPATMDDATAWYNQNELLTPDCQKQLLYQHCMCAADDIPDLSFKLDREFNNSSIWKYDIHEVTISIYMDFDKKKEELTITIKKAEESSEAK